MKKKVVLALTIAAISATALIGGTLAWFTASKDVVNTVSTGKVELKVDEPNYVVEKDNQDVVPGKIITKDPTITYEGVNAKIRYMVKVEVKLGDKYDKTGPDENTIATRLGELQNKANTELIFSNMTEEEAKQVNAEYTSIARDVLPVNNWVYVEPTKETGSDLYTYTNSLFKTVKMPESWGNEFQNTQIIITIRTQAVQAEAIGANNEASWENVKETTGVITVE